MCILFVALQAHPQYPLIICANRDEVHYRPTDPAHFWPPNEHILAGKDLEAGGSWLGVNKQGVIAALTNIRDPQAHQAGMKSRGELVVNALRHDHQNQDWLAQHASDYNPFNLLFGNEKRLGCFNSQSRSTTWLTPGFHAISNGKLDDIWPKMSRGTLAIEQHINQASQPDIDVLLSIMRDKTPAADNELPQTGVSLAWERFLSSIYLLHEEYGTRSTSIILKNKLGEVEFTEVRYDGKGRQLGRQSFNIPEK